MRYFKSALIIGSTSAIAKSICIKLAQTGCKKFHLVCRDLDRNLELFHLLQNVYGASVTQEKNDLIFNCFPEKSFKPKIDLYDLYLITAGTLGNPDLARSNISEALKIYYVNYLGLLPWLTEIAKEKRFETFGSLWVFTSVASDRGRPSNYHYGSAKAALSTFCEGLLLRCEKKPFSVRIIKSGFISTRMAIGAPPFLCISTKKVADYLMRNPQKRGFEYLPWWWGIIMFFIRSLPRKYASKL